MNSYNFLASFIPIVPSSFPANLRVDEMNLSSRNMTILWDNVPSIHRNGRILQYTLNYGPVDSEFITVTIDTDQGMFYNAPDLIPGTVYSINIAASTELGKGEFSNDINPQTLEESKYSNIFVYSQSIGRTSWVLLYDLTGNGLFCYREAKVES